MQCINLNKIHILIPKFIKFHLFPLNNLWNKSVDLIQINALYIEISRMVCLDGFARNNVRIYAYSINLHVCVVELNLVLDT